MLDQTFSDRCEAAVSVPTEEYYRGLTVHDLPAGFLAARDEHVQWRLELLSWRALCLLCPFKDLGI